MLFYTESRNTDMIKEKNAGGFTLLEVLTAVIIAAISLVGIYAASTQCLKQIWSARETSRAALAADYEMDNLCTTPWSNITARGSSYTMSVSNNPALALLSGGAGTVQLTPVAGNTNTVQATVALTWTGRNGSLKTNSTALIISKNGFLR
jgi:prepilin-type N-terminal cleavage/methylation domain-containing protein